MLKTRKILSVIAGAIFAGTFLFFPAGTLAQTSKLNIESIDNLRLSGYEKGKEGAILWALTAEKADIAPESKAKAQDINKAIWNAKKVSLFTYSKGERFAKMESDRATFFAEEKSATSDASVFVAGKNFSVSGVGWDWQSRAGENIINVRKNIAVALAPDGKAERISVVADTLKITGTDKETRLSFSGNVQVVQGEIFTSCETIEILLPGNSERAGTQRSDSRIAAVEKITGSGNVRIKRDSQIVFGETVEFLPQKDVFYVRGNARFEDADGRVAVAGETATGNLKEDRVELVGKNETPILVTLPPLNLKKADASARAGTQKTQLVGKHLTVRSADAENIITMKQDVVLTEKDLKISCDTLTVRTARGEKSAAGTPEKIELDSVRETIAEGNVVAHYEDKTLTCRHAKILPNEKQIFLTGTPRVLARDDGATLTADRFEIFLGEDTMKAFSAPATAAGTPPIRVCATLPALSEISEKSAKTRKNAEPTVIFGDTLEVKREKNFTIFDMLGNVKITAEDLTGSCDRVAIFAKPEKSDTADARDAQIHRVAAVGNVDLSQKNTRITGGTANIYPQIDLKEWLVEDANGMDGTAPALITLTGDENAPARNRPRIYALDDAGTPLEFAFAAPEKNVPAEAQAPFIEGDSLEIVAGEARSRFWLRGDVRMVSAGTLGTCRNVEGLMLPKKNSQTTQKLNLEKIIARGDVVIEGSGARASGNTLEILPQSHLAIIAGNARLRDRGGIRITPGNDRFIFDMKKRELVTRAEAGIKSGQVSRPQIIIPSGSDRAFLAPKREIKSGGEKFSK